SKNKFLLYIQHSTVIENYAEKLINNFKKEKLDHIIIKGYVLKDYYPSPEYRSMSDIDILIKPDDREKSHEIMLKLGYKNSIKDSNVWDYRKNKSYIEIHTSLIENEFKEDVNLKEYFSDAWSHIERFRGENCYILDKEYHLIYNLVHIAKHFYNCGCGVRMIMDIAVYINKFGDRLDWNYIWNELEKLDLKLFTENILILCNKWFDTKIDFSYDIEQDFYNKLCENILLGGTFGFNNSNFRIAKIRNDIKNDQQDYRSSLINTLRCMIFPPYEELIKINRYSFLKDRKYLIVFAWIYRWFDQIKSRGMSSIGYILSILKSNKKIDEQKDTMNKLGL
ncbi:MAG: nucleotidyltransferase family protein, partial [Intestinibacter sp.]|uniref:nucleotidyltransferase domain-containing protein n=1 Tax=Intestinibacter sp. TaxID=1965304 RepID=UPI0025C02E89